MKVLITGGAGYIGSTIGSACQDRGLVPVILDDLSTGREEFTAGRITYLGDIADGELIDGIFSDHPDISAVVHCAARIVVPESVADPLGYYRNNVAKTIDLAAHLLRNGCRRVVFSSSASLYEPGPDLLVDESSTLAPGSPYARTKLMIEQVLQDAAVAHDLRVLALRYFNPIGADPQMRTGLQDPAPTHAMGQLIRAHESGGAFTITGVDWPTRDGSGLRDYIHVWDLARAHVAALVRFDSIFEDDQDHLQVINLGTGTGTTVRELVQGFQAAAEHPIEVREAPRRPGDTVGSATRTDKARRLLGWTTELSIEQAARHGLEWARCRREVLGY